MKKILSEELSRAFRSPRIWIALLVIVLSFAWGYRQVMALNPEWQPAYMSYADIWYFIYSKSLFAFLLPLIAVIPFADSLAVDREEGFIRLLSYRSHYRQYAWAKFIANALVTAVLVLFGLLSLYLFCNYLAPRNLFPINQWITPISGKPWGYLHDLFKAKPDVFILLIALRAALMAVLYSSLGMAVGFIFPNRYLTWGLPCAVYLGIHFLSEKTRFLGAKWSPVNAIYGHSIGFYEPTRISAYLHPVTIFLLVLTLALVFGQRRRILG